MSGFRDMWRGPTSPPWVHTHEQRRDELLASANYWRDRALAAERAVRVATYRDDDGSVHCAFNDAFDLRELAPGIEKIAR